MNWIVVPLKAVKVALVIVLSLHGHQYTVQKGPYSSLKACVEATQQFVALAKLQHIKVLDTECEWSQRF